MSIFYPSITTSFHASEGEKLVYKALEKLNNEFSIIHSYRWLGDESQRRSEGVARPGGIDHADGSFRSGSGKPVQGTFVAAQ